MKRLSITHPSKSSFALNAGRRAKASPVALALALSVSGLPAAAQEGEEPVKRETPPAIAAELLAEPSEEPPAEVAGEPTKDAPPPATTPLDAAETRIDRQEAQPIAEDAADPDAEPAPADGEATADDAQAEEINEDEMSHILNAQQQLQQTYTLQRKIDGEVTETETRTIIYSDDTPIRPTEAGRSAREQMMARFDNELLTRTEAFEEAKLDFLVADLDRNGAMNADEFASLVASWNEDEETTDTPVDSVDPEDRRSAEARARLKFAFMAGASSVLTQKDYIREYLVDFDAMDANGDQFLKGAELENFRAANRGDTMGAKDRSALDEATPPSEQ